VRLPLLGLRVSTTLLLAASWALLYGLALFLSGGPVESDSVWTWGAPKSDVLVRLGAAVPTLVRGGDWQRVLAAPFLHASALHLVLNVWIWLGVGGTLERIAGGWRTLVVFVVSASSSTLAQVFLFTGPVPASGAWGGIFGTVGALGVWALFSKHPEAGRVGRSVLFFLAISLLLLLVPGVSAEGHGGGLVAGGLVLGLLGPRRLERAPGRALVSLGVGLVVLLGMAGVTQALAPGRPAAGAAEVERFLGDLVEAERVGERLHQGAHRASPSAREDFGRRLDALLRPAWLERWEGRQALEAYVHAWRPVADGNVPDPFHFEGALARAHDAWRPFEARLRSEFGIRRGLGR
jgi:membrane associated rhomboid family serine protease